jgi:hypothetical protein
MDLSADSLRDGNDDNGVDNDSKGKKKVEDQLDTETC